MDANRKTLESQADTQQDVGIQLTEEATELKMLLASRVYMYTLFHKLLGGEPSSELLEAAGSHDTQLALDLYGEESPSIAKGYAFLERIASTEDMDSLVDLAHDEYMRLFIGPGDLTAPPWESPYTTRQGFVYQESALAVRRAYRLHGFEPKKLLRVPDDHISMMCMFLACVGDESLSAFDEDNAEALSASLREQSSFVHAHLQTWLPEYARLARHSKTAVLYPQLIELLAEFAGLDGVFLDEAAYWVESHEEHGGERAWPTIDSPKIDAITRATESLAKLRLFGLEDNELVRVA